MPLLGWSGKTCRRKAAIALGNNGWQFRQAKRSGDPLSIVPVRLMTPADDLNVSVLPKLAGIKL